MTRSFTAKALGGLSNSSLAVTLLQRKRKQARAVLLRILQIGAAVGLAVGVVAFAARSAVPAIFTQDVTVSAQVQRVLPMIAMFMVSVGMLNKHTKA